MMGGPGLPAARQVRGRWVLARLRAASQSINECTLNQFNEAQSPTDHHRLTCDNKYHSQVSRSALCNTYSLTAMIQ